MARKDEQGQALVMVLLALLLGTLLVSTFLFFASTSQRATTAVQEQTVDRYSADAGVEDAIWKLQNQPGFTQTVNISGTVTYTLSINGQTVVVTVTNALTP